MAKYIKFEEGRWNDKQPHDLQHWIVTNKKSGGGLGTIAYYHPWKRFCFYPEQGTLYDATCLRDIADFCEQKTKELNDAEE